MLDFEKHNGELVETNLERRSIFGQQGGVSSCVHPNGMIRWDNKRKLVTIGGQELKEESASCADQHHLPCSRHGHVMMMDSVIRCFEICFHDTVSLLIKPSPGEEKAVGNGKKSL